MLNPTLIPYEVRLDFISDSKKLQFANSIFCVDSSFRENIDA
jgi:hypothetical protein